jgi:hypothetical protein
MGALTAYERAQILLESLKFTKLLLEAGLPANGLQ